VAIAKTSVTSSFSKTKVSFAFRSTKDLQEMGMGYGYGPAPLTGAQELRQKGRYFIYLFFFRVVFFTLLPTERLEQTGRD